jgi:hypothetical protein
MIHPNGHDSSTATIPTPAPGEAIKTPPDLSSTLQQPIDIATRAKLRAKQQFQQNRFVIIGAGALVVALLIFVATSIPHKTPAQTAKVGTAAVKEEQAQTANTSVDRNLFPITDSGRPSAKESHEGFLNDRDLERSVTRRFHPTSIQPGPSSAPELLSPYRLSARIHQDRRLHRTKRVLLRSALRVLISEKPNVRQWRSHHWFMFEPFRPHKLNLNHETG